MDRKSQGPEVEAWQAQNDETSAVKLPTNIQQSTEPHVLEDLMMRESNLATGTTEVMDEPVCPVAAESIDSAEDSSAQSKTAGATETNVATPMVVPSFDECSKDELNEQACHSPMEHMADSLAQLKNSILDHISQNTEAYFKSQQKNEPDLTTEEKRKIAENLLCKSVPSFLSRYAKYLRLEHLEYFSGSGDSLVQYYVEQRHEELKKSSSYSKATVRNRRLEALKRLSEKGEYFSDKEMKRRNPLLFEELVGQFLTNDQKFEFETTGEAQPTSFAAFFMDIVEKDYAESKMMKEVERDVSMMKTGEPSQSSSNVVLWGEMAANSRSKQRVLNNSRPKEVSEDEKHNLLNEFRSKVFTDFLGGRDDEFDYSEVDGNIDYDDLNAMEQDQQQDYFDSESPLTVMDEDSNSCQNEIDYESESGSESPDPLKNGPT